MTLKDTYFKFHTQNGNLQLTRYSLQEMSTFFREISARQVRAVHGFSHVWPTTSKVSSWLVLCMVIQLWGCAQGGWRALIGVETKHWEVKENIYFQNLDLHRTFASHRSILFREKYWGSCLVRKRYWQTCLIPVQRKFSNQSLEFTYFECVIFYINNSVLMV